MRNAMISGTAALFLAAGALTLTGCTNQTEGERTLERAEELEEAGRLITRGEMLVADGKADVARGEEIRDQGDQTRGDRIIAEGRAKQRQGEELIEQGRRMRD